MTVVKEIKRCPDVCERAEWKDDPVFKGSGQYNCPYHFGVTYMAAIIDGRVLCRHIKRKEGEW